MNEVLRTISELEMDYVLDSMSIFTRFTISKTITPSEIEQAVEKVIKTYPILKAKVFNQTFVFRDNVSAKDIISKINTPIRDENLFSYEIDQTVELFKVFVVFERGKTWFCFISDHSISDAKSACLIVEKMLYFLNHPSEESDLGSVSLAIDDVLVDVPSSEETKAYAEKLHKYLKTKKLIAPKLCQSKTLYQDQTANLKTYKIEKNCLEKLFIAARKHKVTLNSLLVAALLKNNQAQGTVCIGIVIDLKKHLNLLQDQLVCAPVGAFFFLEIQENSSWFEIAKTFQKKLKEHLASKELLLQHFAMIRGQIDPREFKMTSFLSNAGLIEFDKANSSEIEDLYFSGRALTNCPYIACMTHRDAMHLSVTYPSPWYNEEKVDQLIASITNLIK